MPDDGSGKKEREERAGSLVERAMRGARHGRRSTDRDADVPEARPEPPSQAVAERGTDDAPDSVGVADAVTSVRDEERAARSEVRPPPATIVEAAAATASAPDVRPTDGRTVGRPVSRSVELDFERLQELGFITPNRARTRTTEEFRLIKRALLQGVSAARAEGRRNPNLVMITSAAPSEGKTFNAINLAISIALEPDLNTLLIDADLVKPSILSTLGIEAGRGLVDIIESGDFNLADVLIRTNIEGMSLLGAGTPNLMATELLASERMHRFVDEVAQRYNDRIVIFDAPPILATSEASVIAEHMSQIVFVIEADRTSQSRAREALDMIGSGPRVGLVLNKASARFGARQFGGYYKPYSKD